VADDNKSKRWRQWQKQHFALRRMKTLQYLSSHIQEAFVFVTKSVLLDGVVFFSIASLCLKRLLFMFSRKFSPNKSKEFLRTKNTIFKFALIKSVLAELQPCGDRASGKMLVCLQTIFLQMLNFRYTTFPHSFPIKVIKMTDPKPLEARKWHKLAKQGTRCQDT